MTPPQKRLLLVDDHPLIRKSVAATLSRHDGEAYETYEAGSGTEALKLYAAVKPHVVLCDISLGSDMTGIELTQRLTSTYEDACILMLTTQSAEDSIQASFSAGAIGYVHKAVSPETLVGYINDALDGKQVLDSSLAAAAISFFRGDVPMQPKSFRLTPREHEILLLLCAEITSTDEIAEFLVVSKSTVKSHITRLMERLHVNTRTAVVARAWRHRLVTSEEVESKAAEVHQKSGAGHGVQIPR